VNAIRVQVDDQYGTVALILDTGVLHALSARKRGQLQAIADGYVRDLAAALGCTEDHAREVALSELTRVTADEEAYERVAGQRGLLPL